MCVLYRKRMGFYTCACEIEQQKRRNETKEDRETERQRATRITHDDGQRENESERQQTRSESFNLREAMNINILIFEPSVT